MDTPQTAAAKISAKIIIELTLIVVVLATVGYFIWHVRDLESQVAEARSWRDQADKRFEATGQELTNLQAVLKDRQDAHVVIDDHRATKDHRYEQVLQADVNAASWAAASIPDSVRRSDDEDSATGNGPAGDEPGHPGTH